MIKERKELKKGQDEYGYKEIVPCDSTIVQGKTYRFTILTPAMIRMEYSSCGIFVDNPTQMVVNRNFPVPAFEVEETAESLEITTERIRLRYNKKEFSPTGLQIRINGQFGAWSSVWNYGDAQQDLKGTARTLDGVDGSLPLESGILSVQGWSLLDDSASLTIREDGWIQQRSDQDAKDIYFFGYGRAYLECLKDFHQLTGNVPLLPRFALGNWWSRYYKYTEQTYLDLMKRFETKNIPFTVAVIDMDWHITEVDPKYGAGWTGYTWNRKLFPDPTTFMQKLHEMGLKITLNVHPADGVQAFEECYPAFAEYMGVDINKEAPVCFEAGNPTFMKGYFKYIHHPLEEQGVDFWWIDWQQGTHCSEEGLDPLWVLNHYHYLDSCKNGNRGLIFSRYAGVGSHRYPVGFSGDTIISWESLQFQPYFTATASNVGYGWWSHDIGGHMQGIKEDELAVRWLQFGVFSPIMRLHSTNNEFNGKEPWRYNRIAQEIMQNFLRLRHKMIPYLYTMNMRANVESIPLIQPMYYHHPFSEEAYQVPNEYYFGSELVVCPITVPVDKHSGMAVFHAWLPEGIWIDLFTGLIYEGNRRIDLYREIDKIPVLAKGGAIIPMDGRSEGNDVKNPEVLEIYLCAGDDGAFSLWEDDGQDTQFHTQNWVETRMIYHSGTVSTFTIEAPIGNLAVIPKTRTYRLRILGCQKEIDIKVDAGTKLLSLTSCSYDDERGILYVEIPEVAVCDKLTVTMTHVQPHQNQRIDRIFNFLNCAQIAFDTKSNIYHIVQQIDEGVSTVYIISQLIEMGLDKEVLGPILEILTAYAM